MKKTETPGGLSASELITRKIAELGDWRGEALARMRKLINEADKNVVEEWKWSGPVWSCGGIICTGEVYKQWVKLTFAKGASVADPSGSSTPASRAMCGAPSTSAKAKRSMRPHSGSSCARRSP